MGEIGYPWEDPPLDNWFIVAFNHYVRGGHKRLYCAMTYKDTFIEARADNAEMVFWNLKRKAKAYNDLLKEVRANE